MKELILDEIKELEEWYASINKDLPPINLNHYTTINDSTKFFTNHVSFVKRNANNLLFMAYLFRLRDFKTKVDEIQKD